MSENKEKKPVTERIEDTLDEALYKTQNAVYGEHTGTIDDVPATMEDPNGFRRINKHATRRNLALKILKNPKILLALIGVMIAIAVIVAIIK